jgi:uncharacterized protein (TIRG00374 family)
MHSKQLLKSLAVIGFNLIIFFFLIRWCIENIQFDLLIRQIGQTSPLLVVGTAVLNLITVVFYALRLGILIETQFSRSLSTAFLGFGLNNVLPFRLGEVAKLYYAKRYFHIPTTTLFAATLVEKLLYLTALSVLTVFLVSMVNIDLVQKGTFFVLIGLVVVGYASIFVYRKLAHRIEQIGGGSVRIKALFSALHKQSELNHLQKIVLYTVVIWGLNILVVYVWFYGLLPEYQVGLVDAIVLLLVSSLAIAIPTAPAGLGLFEAGIVAYLTQVKLVPSEPALAAAVVCDMAIALPQLAILAGIVLSPRRISGKDGAKP